MVKVHTLLGANGRNSIIGKRTSDKVINSSSKSYKVPPEEKSKALFPDNPRAQELDTKFRTGIATQEEIREFREIVLREQSRFLDDMAHKMVDEMYSK